MPTTIDNLEFFINYSNQLIREIVENLPCSGFFTTILELNRNATPNEVHRKLLGLNYFEINQLISNVYECACHPEEHRRGYSTSTCVKNKMISLFQSYQKWNIRNSSSHDKMNCTI